jgi:hypothetical protein
MPRKRNKQKNPRVNASFKVLEEIFLEAKDECWKDRITFSSKMEQLVKQWLESKKKSLR